MLNRCIINVDREMDDIFEVMELNKESCLFKVKKKLLSFLPMESIKIKHIKKNPRDELL